MIRAPAAAVDAASFQRWEPGAYGTRRGTVGPGGEADAKGARPGADLPEAPAQQRAPRRREQPQRPADPRCWGCSRVCAAARLAAAELAPSWWGPGRWSLRHDLGLDAGAAVKCNSHPDW